MFRKGRFSVLFLILVLVVTALGAGAQGAQAQGSKERVKITLNGSDRPLDIIKQLREEQLIPGGGSIGLQLRRTVIDVKTQGFWYFPVGRGTQLRDYVLHFELRVATIDGETNGCGFAFRIRNDKDFSYVMLTKDRRILLIQNDGGERIVEFDQSIDDLDGIDASEYELSPDQLHFVTLIANGEELILFVNGIEITRETTAKSVRGRFATMLFNEEGNTKDTECRYSNVFAWTLGS